MDKNSEEIFTNLTNVLPYKVNSNLVSAQNRQRNYWTNIEGFTMPNDKNILLKDILNLNDDNNIKLYIGQKHIDAFYKSYKWKPTNIEGKSPTILASYAKHPPHSAYISRNNIESGYRMLSPIECERCQTLPDNYTKYGVFEGNIKEMSRTRRYSAIGNSWTLEIIKLFFKGLLKIK